MTRVYWWTTDAAHPREQWDSGMLQHLLANPWFEHGEAPVQMWGVEEPAIVIIAARHHANDVEQINAFIRHLSGVVLILMGDEEAVFPWKDIRHDNIRFWVMMPHPVRHADMVPWAYFFGTGYKADTQYLTSALMPAKDVAWAFAGQVTNERRKQAVNGLRRAEGRIPGTLVESKSFTAGLERGDYMQLLAKARVAPCPSGPETADTMRLYEALEAGCVPIVDTGPEGRALGYWEMVYGDHPLIVTNDWSGVGGIIEAEAGPRWPLNANLVGAWWQRVKRDMARRMEADLIAVGDKPLARTSVDEVTVIVTVSPIPSHPSSNMLYETIGSIVSSMPGHVRWIFAFDGVRDEQRDLADAYNEHVREMVWDMRGNDNMLPIVSKHHRHQAGMMRLALEQVDTPVVLFVEHDTPFSDEPIDWQSCINLVDYGGVDVLRFHHEAQIHPEHEHLMLDHETTLMLGVPLRRTRQFSARPHLARADYYRDVLDRHFPPGSNCFIEDKMYSVALHDTSMRHAIGIYHPEGSIRRTLHTDGRAGGPKYDDKQVFG